MNDPFETLRKRIAATVWRGTATLDPRIRGQAAAGHGVPADLEAFVHKLHHNAHECSDDDVAALRAAGYSDDQLFELMASAAVGAATKRVCRVLELLDGGRRAIEEG